MFLSSTAAPGTAAPVGSRTVPVIDDVKVWLKQNAEKAMASTIASRNGARFAIREVISDTWKGEPTGHLLMSKTDVPVPEHV
jgi:hypothetical protein